MADRHAFMQWSIAVHAGIRNCGIGAAFVVHGK